MFYVMTSFAGHDNFTHATSTRLRIFFKKRIKTNVIFHDFKQFLGCSQFNSNHDAYSYLFQEFNKWQLQGIHDKKYVHGLPVAELTAKEISDSKLVEAGQ